MAVAAGGLARAVATGGLMFPGILVLGLLEVHVRHCSPSCGVCEIAVLKA